ncbi:nitrate reductase subunit gamma [Pullulanibacillus camelliae]|uniref:Nitrate reductase subunit gamma n=1 Tax=Pullulanibacillus camelliae TaxID=1707096 RepID=A0A8J3DYL7_9BACL|nr:respiratory nitrate reductase subunit gamma [Pullulanibacillus camelliae]GGE50427.1 nitrate reductase subunit gamma [Pullulanibacillus camelliae]
MSGIFWWVIFPYISLAIMIVGVLYRYAFRQLTWAAPSTEFFEKKWLRIGSPLFHYGIVFAIVGHVMGILVPINVYEYFGITSEMYHAGGIIGGGFAGLMVIVGLVILLIRKITIDKVRVHATFADFFIVIALIVVAGIGAYMTIIYNTTVVEYEYRATIGPWFRSLFLFQPNYELMKHVPFIFKLHVLTAFGLFASIPFTRLIHFYSLPVHYPMRAPQQYRSRSNFKR